MNSEGSSGRDPLLGAVLGGKYRVEALLARGGMGRVYRGVQEPLKRPVAIKVLDFHALDTERNDQVEKRFFLEASVCARLTHSNTVTIHDYGTIDGARGVFIVMEFLEGRSMRDLLKEQRALPVARALHIARQICGALIEAHEAGLVHRDLKPGNVVLVTRGNDADFVKVVDFGLVKQVASTDDSAEILTAEGLFLGTPRYMAPEQITGEDVDARTDVYALGVMLYESLAGCPPFRSKVRGQVPVDLFNAHMRKRPPPFSSHELSAGVPREVEALVMRCLEKEPSKRFASMRDVLAAVEQATHAFDESPTRIESMARWAGPGQTIAETLADDGAADQTTVATMEMVPRRDEGKRPLLWFAVSAGVVVLVGGAILAGFVLAGGGVAERHDDVVATPLDDVAVRALPVAEARVAVETAPESFLLRVRSSPEGAEVTRAGERLGVTPLDVEITRASLAAEQAQTVRLTLDGHQPEERMLAAPDKGDLALDVVLKPIAKSVSQEKPARERRRTKKIKQPPPAPDLDIKVDR